MLPLRLDYGGKLSRVRLDTPSLAASPRRGGPGPARRPASPGPLGGLSLRLDDAQPLPQAGSLAY